MTSNFLTSLECTSSTSLKPPFPFGTLLMPSSIMQLSCLTISDLIKPGIPAVARKFKRR